MSLESLPTLIETPFLERILPWRLGRKFAEYNERVLRRHYDRKVLSTRPFTTGIDAPHFELHMLLGHRHVGMCLWSIKSFLYFANRKYRIVLHDDGSLTEADNQILNEHLVNVQVIEKSFADDSLKKHIGHLPNASKFRFSYAETSNHRGNYNVYIMSLILFDINVLSNATKRMIMDADILFFKEPRELIEWIEDPQDTRSLYSVEAFRPYRNKYKQLCFDRRIPAAFNSGLLCLHETVIDLDYLETWIGQNKNRIDHPNLEQIAYEHIVKKQPGNMPLPDSYPFNNMHEDAIMTHFGIKILYFRNLKRIEKLLA